MTLNPALFRAYTEAGDAMDIPSSAFKPLAALSTEDLYMEARFLRRLLDIVVNEIYHRAV